MRRKNPDVKIVNGYEITPEANLRNVFFEPETDLRGANLEDSKLTGVWMKGVHLQGAHLERAYLVEAHLEGAHLEGAHLENADLSQAHLDGTHFNGAYLQNAKLSATRLVLTDFTGANLDGADFYISQVDHANFTDANLSGADLRGANLSKSILKGAILDGAKIDGSTRFPADYDTKKLFPKFYAEADFRNKDLRNEDFRGAILTSARLEGANLEGAHLEYANLQHARLESANLEGAHLEGASLYYANLEGAHLEGAILEFAHLQYANLDRAHLNGANLHGAMLENARLNFTDFTNANLSRAKIRYTDLSLAILDGAILQGAIVNIHTYLGKNFDNRQFYEISDARSYGEMTGAVLKLGKPDSPPRAADFKRKYPIEFDRLVKDTGGKDFTDSVKENIRNKYRTPFDWYVTRGLYDSRAQRLSKNSNNVILLNIDLEKINATEKQIELIKKLAKVSRRSDHPNTKDPLFTIGWVRFDVDEAHKVYLVEEVQSDVWVVRQQTKNLDGQTQAQLQQAGISPEDFNDVYETLRPYADRFYEDALGILFVEAEEKGYSVEMLGYEDKREFGSPRSIYTDLPRKMGMRPQPTQTDLRLKDKVSYYKPNPSRPRRRY